MLTRPHVAYCLLCDRMFRLPASSLRVGAPAPYCSLCGTPIPLTYARVLQRAFALARPTPEAHHVP